MPQHETDGLLPDDADILREITPSEMTQKCRGCKRKMPLNDQWFNRDRSRRSGYKPVCIECMAKKRRAKDNQQIEKLTNRMDLAILNMFHDVLDDFTGGVPHIARFAEEILSETGGLKGFMQQIMADRLACKAGSAIRYKYDQMLYQFMLKATEYGAVKTPVELMGKEECQKELDQILEQEVVRRTSLRLLPGTVLESEQPAPAEEPPHAKAQ